MSLSAVDRKMLNCIQESIPLNNKPFKILSQKPGIKAVRTSAAMDVGKSAGFFYRPCLVYRRSL